MKTMNCSGGEVGQRKSHSDNNQYSNAQIAANAYYGINQPIRDPFLKPAIQKQNQINARVAKLIQNTLPVPRKLLEILMIELRNNSIDAITTKGFGTWAPNSPRTIKAKNGKDTPLVDLTIFMRSIDYDVIDSQVIKKLPAIQQSQCHSFLQYFYI